MSGPIKPDGRRWTYRHWQGRRRLQRLCAIMAAAALAAAALIFAWSKGAFLPGWILWTDKSVELPKNMQTPTAISLNQKHLTVYKDGAPVWESPDTILVQDFLWCDINHDDADELILLCWRIGRYGNARPYWIKKDERTWSQHIYIYQWRDNEIHPLWMASDIGMDVVSFEFSGTDRLSITETSGRRTSWDWVSWGLSFLRELSAAPEA